MAFPEDQVQHSISHDGEEEGDRFVWRLPIYQPPTRQLLLSPVRAKNLEKANAALAQAKTAQDAAELKLSYTRITAPVDGTVGQKAARVGGYVSAGKPLLAVVPLDAVYITANFRETQLAHVQAGQAVEVKVDALPGEILKGKVESLSPASGVSYSAVAPHNATGNFTKIVQRLPVRISIDPNQLAAIKLRVGMSVRPIISIRE